MDRMRAAGRRPALLVFATLALALPARGQSSCSDGLIAPGGSPDTARALLRPISLRARNLTLRDALERVASAGHLRISYSAELLPVDRSACADFDSWPVGQALRVLLHGLPVRVIPAGGDQVVLAPGAVASAAAQPSIPLVSLAPMVVKGTPASADERSRTVALDVVDGRGLERQAGDNLA
ncbi:MAG TPA: hypothetical protein VF832_14830, partial [Longimicrobiales bacterium]